MFTYRAYGSSPLFIETLIFLPVISNFRVTIHGPKYRYFTNDGPEFFWSDRPFLFLLYLYRLHTQLLTRYHTQVLSWHQTYNSRVRSTIPCIISQCVSHISLKAFGHSVKMLSEKSHTS